MSTVLLLVLLVLFIFTLLSRLGHLNLFGVSIVFSDSMVPALRRGDMVFYAHVAYAPGDIVVYCRTVSLCIVHRFVREFEYGGAIITKGDANPVEDPPVSRDMVRGRVLLAIPREVWIPITLLSLALALAGMARAGGIGYSYALALAISVAYIVAVYVVIPPPADPTPIEPPTLHLAGVDFDRLKCEVRIRYTGELDIASATAYVNNVTAPAYVVGKSVVVKPDPRTLKEAYERGEEVSVRVFATLSVGTLRGEYRVKVFGERPTARAVNGSLVIENPNCFPVEVSVTLQYSYDVGDPWRYLNTSLTVEGLGVGVVRPPEGARFVYAYVYYTFEGEVRWLGVPVRYG